MDTGYNKILIVEFLIIVLKIFSRGGISIYIDTPSSLVRSSLNYYFNLIIPISKNMFT